LGVLIVVISLCCPLFAQMSPEEAAARLKEREQAASTQPDTTDVAMLRSIIADQKRQIEALKAEVARLEHQVSSPAPVTVAVPSIKPRSTFASREQMLEEHGITRWSVDAATKIDRSIDAYAAANNVDPKLVCSMHEGVPAIGIPEDAAKIFLSMNVTLETQRSREYDANLIMGTSNADGKWSWDLTFTDGKLSAVITRE